MKKNTITKFQYFTVFFFLLNAFIPMIGFHKLTMTSKQDALFAIILGTGLMILFVFLTRNIYHYLPNKPLLEKIRFLFPKSYLILYLSILIILLSALFQVTQQFTGFVRFYLTPQITPFWITLSFSALLFYFLKKSKESLFRTAEICFYIYLLFFIISVFGILPQSNFLNIKPLFSTGVQSIFNSSFIFFLSLPLPFFLLLHFPKNWLQKKESGIKTWGQSIFWSGIFLFTNLFLILSSIGVYLMNLYKNPLMITYQKISFLNILERVETTLSFSYILLYFFIIVFLIYALKELIFQVFPTTEKKKDLVLLLILVLILLGNQFLNFHLDFYILINLFLVFLISFLSVSIHLKKDIER
ncbi:MAG: GerAB/ArcD/ProY family transporter [Bacilli bacterium]|nr:GerAB/ArcD/ProY family transporter [Bacilli bacterium]